MFSLSTIFAQCSILIEQLIKLIKVRTEKLKFKTDLRDWVMDGWSVCWTRDGFQTSPFICRFFLFESCAQSSRSKSTTCPKKGRLLRFELNSTTLDGGAQKLENDVWHDSESIATKVCSQVSVKTPISRTAVSRYQPSSTRPLHCWQAG